MIVNGVTKERGYPPIYIDVILTRPHISLTMGTRYRSNNALTKRATVYITWFENSGNWQVMSLLHDKIDDLAQRITEHRRFIVGQHNGKDIALSWFRPHFETTTGIIRGVKPDNQGLIAIEFQFDTQWYNDTPVKHHIIGS